MGGQLAWWVGFWLTLIQFCIRHIGFLLAANARSSTCCLLLVMSAVLLCECLSMCLASRMGSHISVCMSVSVYWL